MRLWCRKKPPVQVDMTSGDEAAAFRRKVEARWPEVHQERHLHAVQAAQARRVLRENHFAPKIRLAFEGRPTQEGR